MLNSRTFFPYVVGRNGAEPARQGKQIRGGRTSEGNSLCQASSPGWPTDRGLACATASRTQDSLAHTVLGADRLPSAAVPEHGQRALHLQETKQISLQPQTTDSSALRRDSSHHGWDHGVERPERRRGACWVTRPARSPRSTNRKACWERGV